MEPGGSSQGLSIIPILSQTNPIPRISLRSNVVLLSHLRLGLPKDLFPVGLPNSMSYGTSRFNTEFTITLQ